MGYSIQVLLLARQALYQLNHLLCPCMHCVCVCARVCMYVCKLMPTFLGLLMFLPWLGLYFRWLQYCSELFWSGTLPTVSRVFCNMASWIAIGLSCLNYFSLLSFSLCVPHSFYNPMAWSPSCHLAPNVASLAMSSVTLSPSLLGDSKEAWMVFGDLKIQLRLSDRSNITGGA